VTNHAAQDWILLVNDVEPVTNVLIENEIEVVPVRNLIVHERRPYSFYLIGIGAVEKLAMVPQKSF
jgi:hypothetical protein